MSNYTQITSFGPKDALTTGNSAKLIKGTELDSELAAISTAITSKADTSSVASLLAPYALLASANTFTALNTFSDAVTPIVVFRAVGAAADQKNTQIRVGSTGSFTISAATDAAPGTSGSSALAVSRTGAAWSVLQFGNATDNPTYSFLGTGTLTKNGATIWHSANDGAGSGLDADLLDGQSSAAFAAASHTHANGDLSGYTAADVLAKLLTVDGAGSGLDADLLDGQSSAFYQTATNLTAGTIPDARIASTGVTQHQASLALAASQTTSGTFADARIAASNVAQHKAKNVSALAGTAVTLQADPGGTPSGSPGDMFLYY